MTNENIYTQTDLLDRCIYIDGYNWGSRVIQDMDKDAQRSLRWLGDKNFIEGVRLAVRAYAPYEESK